MFVIEDWIRLNRRDFVWKKIDDDADVDVDFDDGSCGGDDDDLRNPQARFVLDMALRTSTALFHSIMILIPFVLLYSISIFYSTSKAQSPSPNS